MRSEKLIHSAYIGLGSNLGDSKQLLARAWQTLAEYPELSTQKLSSPYTTKPFDMESPHWFVNAVGRLQTSLSPHELLTLLLHVEKQFGRARDVNIASHQDRTLDLDLLLYDTLILSTDDLVVPHPEMHKRLFVLVPLAEIAPDELHPVRKVAVSSLLDTLVRDSEDEEVQLLSWTNDG